MITRQEALALIAILDESPVIAPKVKDMLNEIAYCIDIEEIGLHVWGAPEKLPELDKLIIDSIENEKPEAIEQYIIALSEFEERENTEDDGTNSSEPTDPSVQDLSENKPKKN